MGHNYKEVDGINSKQKALHIAHIAQEKKAQALLILDLRRLTVICDWFVILSGASTRMTKAIADEIQKAMGQKRQKAKHMEGYSAGNWILLDYSDVVVHIFLGETRSFYNLERLWGDAPSISLT